MPFLTAKRIHNGLNWLPEGSVIEIDDKGTITSVSDQPNEKATVYDGILAPGFVNVHCHLELSHMKGMIPEHTGLIPFLKTIPRHRNDFTEEQKTTARHTAFSEMLQNGIVAVGDIANTTDTIDLRALDQIHYNIFVESIGFSEVNAARSFGYALQTFNAFAAQKPHKHILRQAIVPHAPYSVSAALFGLIDAHSEGTVISIHNQESQEEDKYYISKEGGVQDLLHSLGIDDSFFIPTGRTSLQSYLPLLSPERPVIFVHSTYTSLEDIRFALAHLRLAHWCLCPNANLYIENKLPDIQLFADEGLSICIGTDSLASNHQLCILSELHSIKQHVPTLDWEQLLQWATYNGAAALHLQEFIGTIEAGKKPGILQITGLDDTSCKPTVKRII